MKLAVGELYAICSNYYLVVKKNNEVIYSNMTISTGVFDDVKDLLVEEFGVFKDENSGIAYLLVKVHISLKRKRYSRYLL